MAHMQTSSENFTSSPHHLSLPLKPFPLALLIALAAGEAHAYAIQQRAIADVQGAIFVGSRAVYRELPRLVQAGLITLVPDTRPIRYALTKHGRTLLIAERIHAQNRFQLLQNRL
jgi:DNA-binding PadR family transcriptional regulator